MSLDLCILYSGPGQMSIRFVLGNFFVISLVWRSGMIEFLAGIEAKGYHKGWERVQSAIYMHHALFVSKHIRALNSINVTC